MVDKNKTEIVFVIDRSGSMSTIRADMEGGFKTLIDGQKALPGECRVTLYQFDSACELVYQDVPIAEVQPMVISPRGSTALLDAMGMAIERVGSRLRETHEDNRPGALVFVTITDGHENSSREFGRDKIRDLIRRQEEVYNWQFMYLGADEKAFKEAQSMGYSVGKFAKFIPDAFGTRAVFDSVGSSIGDYRTSIGSAMSYGAQELRIPETPGIEQPKKADTEKVDV